MEATVEVSRSLFCIKFMKRDVNVTKLDIYADCLTLIKLLVFQILTDVYVLFLDDKSWKIHV